MHVPMAQARTLDILNCAASGRVQFTYRCPMTWEQLTVTDDPRKRQCQGCHRSVFLCHDANEAGLRADQDECIAVPAWLADGARDRHARQRIVVGQATHRNLFADIVEERLSEQ